MTFLVVCRRIPRLNLDTCHDNFTSFTILYLKVPYEMSRKTGKIPASCLGSAMLKYVFGDWTDLTVVFRSHLRPTWEILWSHYFVLLAFKFLYC